jgi:transposase
VRGADERNGSLFSYVDLEARVPTDHPLRVIRRIADEALDGMSAKFDACYGRIGRPSIAPERLMRALLVQAFYSIRSERQLMERLEFDLLFRWFVGLGIDDRVWDASTFSKNRDRLLEADAAADFLLGRRAAPAGSAADEPRPFLGRRHADRRLGLDEELPAEGAARSGWPCR